MRHSAWVSHMPVLHVGLGFRLLRQAVRAPGSHRVSSAGFYAGALSAPKESGSGSAMPFRPASSLALNPISLPPLTALRVSSTISSRAAHLSKPRQSFPKPSHLHTDCSSREAIPETRCSASPEASQQSPLHPPRHPPRCPAALARAAESPHSPSATQTTPSP
jgi:hypothetical protein